MLYSALVGWLLLPLTAYLVAAQTCSSSSPCEIGCCNKFGNCGFGPDFCGTDCVAQCSRKSQCDPGFGSQWAEKAKCPLNVCCSKYGFCGTTAEFCGDKKVSHKTCSKDNGNARVIGYYEGWAHERPCNIVWPEQIPTGVYTHINFAFATINPKTFTVEPTSKYDINLYQRITSLKNDDPGLKVFIAIGGWTFNDPGPTATTFSDISASISRQKMFIKSLISFMSTYGFDGVDLDWEYPGADDRSGRSIDYKTFPIFMRRLKSALRSVGKEVSITLPASYWYLQHFDLEKLAKSVDWFNIMSYDLHGTWDKGNKWTGNYLNAHTNLTEIDTALDLIWRNDIDPSMVVLGLAFYGRSFTASSTTCLKPGCTFESGGRRGKCSKAVGVLLNSEIDDIVQERGITPEFYKDAAVKVASWDDQWVSYDDSDTFKIKSQYAQSRCMGGLMVWAISQDTQDAKYSMALAGGTNRLNSLVPHIRQSRNKSPYNTVLNNHEQCRWSKCRQGCPSGWIPVPRQDPAARHNEIMLDETICKSGVQTFCCPPSKMPVCGWYNYNNGGCRGGSCPNGMQEIGSTSKYCRYSYQLACCAIDTENMKIYDTYEWSADKKCSVKYLNCPVSDPKKDKELTSSFTGSGGSRCPPSYGEHIRKLCADVSDDNKKFFGCLTYAFQSEGCADDMFRLAYDTGHSGYRRKGWTSCCHGKYQEVTKTLNPKVAHRRRALLDWLKKPTCPNPGSLIATIGGLGVVRRGSRGSYYEVEGLLVALLLKSYPAVELQWATEDWNQAMSSSFPGLVMPEFGERVRKHPSYHKDGPYQMAHNVICDPLFWNSRDSRTKTVDCSECDGPVCFLNSKRNQEIAHLNSSLSVLEPGLGLESSRYSTLTKRTGPRDYTADLMSPTGQRFTFVATLPAHESAGGFDENDPIYGQALDFDDSGDCGNAALTTLAIYNGRFYETEHPIEGQQMRNFFRDAAAGRLASGATATIGPVSISFFIQADDSSGIGSNPPPLPGGVNYLRVIDRVMECLGSYTNTATLTLLQKLINSKKARLVGGKDGLARARWAALCQDEARPEQFLLHIRGILSAINYLDYSATPNVNSYMTTVANNIRDQLRYAQTEWNTQNPTDQVQIAEFWSEWIKDFYSNYLITRAETQVRDMVAEMRRYWGVSTSSLAPLVLRILELLETQAESLTIDTTGIN